MVRGNMRGHRGGRGANRGGMKLRPPFIPHVTFDIFLAEPAFPPVRQGPSPNEEPFQAVQPFLDPRTCYQAVWPNYETPVLIIGPVLAD